MPDPNPQAPPSTTVGAAKDHHRTTTTVYILLATSVFSLFFILFFHTPTSTQPSPPSLDPYLFPNRHSLLHQNSRLLVLNNQKGPHFSPFPTPPSIAYLISGSANDSGRILRLLYAIYHPRNQYLLHLDHSANQTERDFLAFNVQSIPVFKASQNVNVIGKADFVHPKGSTPISATLRGASILLKISQNWDWFINLSAADYPLITQDDLLHILSYLPKELNFVNHTGYIGWLESQRLTRIIVDPGLYLTEEEAVFYGTQKRELPNAYRLFKGSSSAILSRKLIEFCISGTENLPRTLLMYLSNVPSSKTFYFPTILCNSHCFSRTIINHSLIYTSYDTKQSPVPLNSSDFNDVIKSGAAFASPFPPDDAIIDLIDKEILHRKPGELVPGGWCLGEPADNPCSLWGDSDVLRPGSGAKRLERRVIELFSNGTLRSNQCAVQ